MEPTAPLTQQQIDLIAYHTHRAATKALKKYMRGALVAFLILLAGIGYALSTKPDIAAQRAGLISSCERVNILRSQSNNSDLVSFRILTLSSQRERQLSRTDNVNTRSTHLKSAKLLEAQAGQLTITGLTNCSLAVDHAAKYRFPIANPIGDPLTGKLAPGVQKIVDQSHALLRSFDSADRAHLASGG